MTTNTPAAASVHSDRRQRDPAALRASSYTFWAEERVRFADLDINGHVNNIAFAVYAESGRAAFLHDTGLWKLDDNSRQNVLAHIEIDYLHELRYPSQIAVGVRVLSIGRTSFRLGVGLFDGERCAATIATVQVRIDADTKAPIPLDADERLTLQRYVTDPSAG